MDVFKILYIDIQDINWYTLQDTVYSRYYWFKILALQDTLSILHLLA